MALLGFLGRSCWAGLLTLGLFGIAVSSLAQTSTTPSAGAQDSKGSTGKRDSKSSGPATTKLKITISTDADKPIPNASVYVRFYSAGGFLRHEKLEEMNFKTNQDGSVKVPEIPQGRILIQVIATGWHTYGQWYDVDTAEQSISIKLVPPHHWY